MARPRKHDPGESALSERMTLVPTDHSGFPHEGAHYDRREGDVGEIHNVRKVPEPEVSSLGALPFSLVATNGYRSVTIDFASVRTLWRNNSATGLRVRFFNVKIATGLV